MKKKMLIVFGITLLITVKITISCQKETIPTETIQSLTYSISGNKIINQNQPIQLIGVNAFHSFSAGSNDMSNWNIDVVREFIGNVKENPIDGNPIQDTNGSYLHSLQKIVDGNRLNNKVTILCAFGWDGTNVNLYTGKRPTQTFWWNDYKIKLQQWATFFKNQPDVWIEVWNEPYNYNRTDGYTDAIWMSDMNELTQVVRAAGNANIILIPCCEQGQDESVVVNQGANFLNNKSNIIFDIHAYEKWLLIDDSTNQNRLEVLKQNNLPIIFGETAPMNAGVLMNPQSFLNILYNRGLSVCAWTWKNDETDQDALLTTTGLLNNINNNNWGSIYKELTTRVRNP